MERALSGGRKRARVASEALVYLVLSTLHSPAAPHASGMREIRPSRALGSFLLVQATS